MVQGLKKIASAKKSGGGERRKAGNSRKNMIAKGKRNFNRKKKNTTLHSQADKDTTAAINRKNEVLVAAKAVGVGTQFFLSDIAAKGKKENDKMLRQRNKKQCKTKLSNRLKEQLHKLGKEA